MKTRIAQSILAIALVTFMSATTWAKGPTPQNHHCVKDGATMEGKTRKECKKEGGKWEKDEAAKTDSKTP